MNFPVVTTASFTSPGGRVVAALAVAAGVQAAGEGTGGGS